MQLMVLEILTLTEISVLQTIKVERPVVETKFLFVCYVYSCLLCVQLFVMCTVVCGSIYIYI